MTEARFLVYVTEAVRLLSGSDALKPASDEKIRAWFLELLTWLLDSEHGRKAKLAKNNIGFWYDLQCMVYAQFCGRTDLSERIIREDVVPRLNAQMAADGIRLNEARLELLDRAKATVPISRPRLVASH